MASGRQFQSAIVFGKKRKFENVFICIWHARNDELMFEIMISWVSIALNRTVVDSD